MAKLLLIPAPLIINSRKDHSCLVNVVIVAHVDLTVLVMDAAELLCDMISQRNICKIGVLI